MNDIKKDFDSLIDTIKNSKEYNNYLYLKDLMLKDTEIMALINEVKLLQKKIVNSTSYSDKKAFNDKINENLKKLDDYPIYVEYSNCQDEFNNTFQIIRESLEKEISKILN